MRKITRQAANAFFQNKNFALSNTQVYNNALFLHNNKIAWKDSQDNLCFCLCGYNTNTTKDRLRGLGLSIKQKNFVLFCNNEKINAQDSFCIIDNKIVKL